MFIATYKIKSVDHKSTFGIDNTTSQFVNIQLDNLLKNDIFFWIITLLNRLN
jgi:hypothetical protein